MSIFSYSSWPFVYFPWWNVYSNPLGIFELGSLFFVVDLITGILYIFWYQVLIRYMTCKYLLSFWALSFHSVDSVLCTRVLNFDEVQFLYFFLLLCFWCYTLKTTAKSRVWQISKPWRFHRVFSSKSFIVLALTFRSLIHFDWIFIFSIM